MSLYEIKSELLELADALAVIDSPDAEAALAEHRVALIEALTSKAEDYAALIRVCESRAEARRVEAERMEMLAAADEAVADRLKRLLMDAMIATNNTKLDTERFRLSIKRNGGKIPVVISDETAIPIDFRVPKITESIDKDAIREALESGTNVPGASLGERGQRLELR